MNDIQATSNQIIGLANAAQTSVNRASGAFVSNSPENEAMQLNAMQSYIQQEMTASAQIGNDIVQLSNVAAREQSPKPCANDMGSV